ncbi:MAG: carboxypeptidase-like regulatory domain-containing protein [bacterium]
MKGVFLAIALLWSASAHGASVRGAVVDDDGRPLGCAHVFLAPKFPSEMSPASRMPIASSHQMTPESGDFSYEHVPPGIYHFEARHWSGLLQQDLVVEDDSSDYWIEARIQRDVSIDAAPEWEIRSNSWFTTSFSESVLADGRFVGLIDVTNADDRSWNVCLQTIVRLRGGIGIWPEPTPFDRVCPDTCVAVRLEPGQHIRLHTVPLFSCERGTSLVFLADVREQGALWDLWQARPKPIR